MFGYICLLVGAAAGLEPGSSSASCSPASVPASQSPNVCVVLSAVVGLTLFHNN